jgi:hypothetical protein
MKKLLSTLLVLIFLLLTVTYFIPATIQKQVFIASTFQNIISSVTVPQNWIKWNADIRKACLKNSSACSFGQDTAQQLTLSVPGKKISITTLNYLLYRVEETAADHTGLFTFSVIPYVGNGQPRSQHNTTIAYAQPTRLLYRLLPFLNHSSFAEKTISDLASYLQDNTRFYGFPINLIQDTNSLFLTKKQIVAQKDMFPAMTVLFSGIESAAAKNNCRPGFKNISFNNTGNDSTEILAGLNIDKVIDGSDGYGFMQLVPGQILLTGHYEGPFNKRTNVYQAMEKYLLDHQLVKGGASFERYLSPLPVSDASAIRMELCYPLRY